MILKASAENTSSSAVRRVSSALLSGSSPMMAGMSDKVREALLNMTLFPARLGKAIEYAKLVSHIVENPMLNGEVIRLDGGIRMGAQ